LSLFARGSGFVEEPIWNVAVAVFSCEVVHAVLFSCGGTPIHPFVNPPAEAGSRSGLWEPDTEYSTATVSQTPAVSIRITLDIRGRVHGDTQTGVGVCEGLFPKEGPMQPSFSPTCSSLRSRQSPARLFYTCPVRWSGVGLCGDATRQGI